jgi:hypothetical protein
MNSATTLMTSHNIEGTFECGYSGEDWTDPRTNSVHRLFVVGLRECARDGAAVSAFKSKIIPMEGVVRCSSFSNSQHPLATNKIIPMERVVRWIDFV